MLALAPTPTRAQPRVPTDETRPASSVPSWSPQPIVVGQAMRTHRADSGPGGLFSVDGPCITRARHANASCERLLQVGNEVAGILDPHRIPHQPFRNAKGLSLGGGILDVT